MRRAIEMEINMEIIVRVVCVPKVVWDHVFFATKDSLPT